MVPFVLLGFTAPRIRPNPGGGVRRACRQCSMLGPLCLACTGSSAGLITPAFTGLVLLGVSALLGLGGSLALMAASPHSGIGAVLDLGISGLPVKFIALGFVLRVFRQDSRRLVSWHFEFAA